MVVKSKSSCDRGMWKTLMRGNFIMAEKNIMNNWLVLDVFQWKKT